VPADHLLRQVAAVVDFSFVRRLTARYYSHSGKPSIDPVALFKMALIGYLYGITSELWLDTVPEGLPPLGMLLVWDNLSGHKSPTLVDWLLAHGVAPLYMPLSGSWLNMAAAIQRIMVARAVNGQHPAHRQAIIDWIEATMRGWNRAPTPFTWGGKRHERRVRARCLAGSGATILYLASIAA